LKINFHKSEVFCFGDAKQQESSYASTVTCSIGTLPFKYLGFQFILKDKEIVIGSL
jgi:hypothetical protein